MAEREKPPHAKTDVWGTPTVMTLDVRVTRL